MPLSEEELRLLEQMERALVEEDPKFASTLRGTTLRRNARRRSFVAAGVFVLGIVVLMTGAVMQLTVVGIVGFVVMLVSAYIALIAWKGQSAAGEVDEAEALLGDLSRSSGLRVVQGGKSKRRPGRGRSKGRGRNRQAGFMDRIEDRWRRRRDENNGF